MVTGQEAAEPRRASTGLYPTYVLALLTLMHVCYFIDRSVLAVVMEPLRHEFGLSDGQLGLLYGFAYMLAFAIAGVPIGLLVDRVNRKNLLSGIIVIWSGLTALAGVAQSYLALVLVRMGVGATEAGAMPSALSLLSDYFDAKRRATVISIWMMGASAGFAISFVVGGYVAQHYGWRHAFFLAAVPGLVLATLILLTVREPVRGAMEGAKSAEKPPSFRQLARYMLARPSIWHLSAAMVLHSLTTSGLAAFMSSFLIRQHHLELAQSGVVIALSVGVCGAIGGLASGVLSDRIARRRTGGFAPERLGLVCAVAAIAAMLAGWATLLAPLTAGAIAGLFLYAFLQTAFAGPGHALMLTLLEARMRGAGIAALSAMSNLIGSGLGNYLVGALSDAIGGPSSLKWAMAAVLLLNAWAAFHFLMAARRAGADLAMRPVAQP